MDLLGAGVPLTNTLPMVRSGAIRPILLWMAENGIRAEPRLVAAGLSPETAFDASRTIPLRAGLRFFVGLGREVGPDLGIRAVSDRSIGELGLLSELILVMRTPRQVLGAAVRAFSYHGSHEQFALATTAEGVVVRYLMRVPLDAEERHLVQSYVAALVRAACGGTGVVGPRVVRVAITPHPAADLGHVASAFRCPVAPATGDALEIVLVPAGLDRPYLGPPRGDAPALAEKLTALRGDGTLAWSIRSALPDLLAGGLANAGVVADLAFMTRRTLQRRLNQEGTSLSQLIDDTRRELALSSISGTSAMIGDVAAQLGYSSPTSLSRSVRRWTGTAPRRIRAG